MNDLLKTYVGELAPDGEGQTTQQAGGKVTLDDILKLSTNVANQILAVTNALVSVTAAASDVTKVSPMKFGAAKKSIVYTKDALSGLGVQLNTQAGIIKQMQIYKQATKNL